MSADIRDQPNAWRRVIARSTEIEALGRRLGGGNPPAVLFVARGSSGHAALYGQYLVETLCGIPTGSFAPSGVTVYGSALDLRGSVMVAISQSGGSPDLVESLRAARAAGAVTVAVVNVADSALAHEAEFVVDVRGGEELAVAATKTYTSALLAVHLLISGLAGVPSEPVEDLPGLAELLLGTIDLSGALEVLGDHDRLAVVGRGYSLPSARESALKLMETCSVSAHGFSSAEFLHGPVAMLSPRMPLLVISASAGFPSDVVDHARAVGAEIVVVGATGLSAASVGIGEGLSPSLRPILEILPVQLLALELARHRGLDPDQPVGLLKATATR